MKGKRGGRRRIEEGEDNLIPIFFLVEALVVDTAGACPGVVECAVGGGGRLLDVDTVLDAGEIASLLFISYQIKNNYVTITSNHVVPHQGIAFLGLLHYVDDISHCSDAH